MSRPATISDLLVSHTLSMERLAQIVYEAGRHAQALTRGGDPAVFILPMPRERRLHLRAAVMVYYAQNYHHPSSAPGIIDAANLTAFQLIWPQATVVAADIEPKAEPTPSAKKPKTRKKPIVYNGKAQPKGQRRAAKTR